MRICLYVAALVSILTGCATTMPVLPDVQPSSVTQASVVVAASCVTAIPIAPAWAVDALPPNADEFMKTRALIAEHLQRKLYVDQLQAILLACQ